MGTGQRGEYGTAAASLKQALLQRLEKGSTAPLNAVVLRAVDKVNLFLRSGNESAAEFSQLQEEVRQCLLTLPTSAAASLPAPPPRNPADSVRHRQSPRHSPAPLSPAVYGSLRPYRASMSPTRARASTATGVMLHRGGSVSARGVSQVPGSSYPGGRLVHTAGSDGSHSPGSHYGAMSFNEVEAELNALYAYGGKARSLSTSDVDWTMPKRLIQTKAFALNANNAIGDMIRTQDTLAACADAAANRARVESQAATRAMYDVQLCQLMERRRAEAEAKKDMARFMEGVISENKRREAADKVARAEAAAAYRAQFSAQVAERAAARDAEAQQAARAVVLERIAADEVARQERERRVRVAAENRAKNAATQRELSEAVAAKARALVAQHEEERAANEAYVKELDRREAARRAEVAARAARQRAAFERAGGTAMLANLAEAAARDAATAAAAQAAFEAKLEAKLAAEKARKQEETRARVATLNAQMGEREAARKAEADTLRAQKAAMDAEAAAYKEGEARAKAERKVRQAAECAAMKAAVAQENRRLFETYNVPLDPRDTWVHKPVMELRQRGFTNMSVPHNVLPATLMGASLASVAAVAAVNS